MVQAGECWQTDGQMDTTKMYYLPSMSICVMLVLVTDLEWMYMNGLERKGHKCHSDTWKMNYWWHYVENSAQILYGFLTNKNHFYPQTEPKSYQCSQWPYFGRNLVQNIILLHPHKSSAMDMYTEIKTWWVLSGILLAFPLKAPCCKKLWGKLLSLQVSVSSPDLIRRPRGDIW